MATVLIITSQDDYSADLIVHELNQRDVQVVRLDPGSGDLHLEAELTAGGWRGVVGDEHRAARLDEVTSVLWRWPTSAFQSSVAVSAQDWAAKENARALNGILRSLNVRWVNHPDRTTAANWKPEQLRTARRLGLAVPDTLITTKGERVRAWAAERGPVLYKAFHAGGLGEGAMIPATVIDPADVPEELGNAGIFQEVVTGRNIRATVLGGEVFAVRIEGDHPLDWRPVQDQLTLVPVDPPRSALFLIRAFVATYGLEYSALDLIEDHRTGTWVLLENNPTGQYGFVELQTNLDITGTLADLLCTPVTEASGNSHEMAL